MHLKNYFSKIYVINLPERVDRRREVEKMLLSFGIDAASVHFFPGIRPSEAAGFRTVGAHGCFLSHLQILEEALHQNLNSVLIIEDDLEIINNFPKVENEITNFLRTHPWDFVYLGHSLRLPSQNGKFAFERYFENIVLTHFIGFHHTILPPLVNFLKALLKEPAGSAKGGPMDIDGAYSTFRQRHPTTITLVANPSLGYQRSSLGDISPYKWFDRPGIFRSISSKLRKIKRLFNYQG